MNRVWVAALLLSGCVKANLVIVDRKTSLEQQSAGSYPVLATELENGAVQPGPVAYTREQMAGGGESAADALVAEGDQSSDSARVDALLVRRCVGESLDGSLVRTEDTCTGNAEPQEVARLIERVNRTRQQVWSYLETRYPEAKPAAVRDAWRQTRLREMVCGGNVQVAIGKWEVKKC